MKRVDAMGGLFTHEYLSAHKVVLGFEQNHLVYIDTRMPRDSCWYDHVRSRVKAERWREMTSALTHMMLACNCSYAVTKSPMGATGELRRSKATNKFAVFGLGGCVRPVATD